MLAPSLFDVSLTSGNHAEIASEKNARLTRSSVTQTTSTASPPCLPLAYTVPGRAEAKRTKVASTDVEAGKLCNAFSDDELTAISLPAITKRADL